MSDELFAKTPIPKAYMTLALPVVGLAFGGQPLIGYTYGAKDKERMQQVIAFALKVVVGTSAVLAASRHRIHGHRSGFNLYLSGYREKSAVAFPLPLPAGACLCRRPVSGLPVGITHSLFRLPWQVFSS